MRWSRRNELNVVRSVIGNTDCNPTNGRNAIGWPAALVVPVGIGALDSRKRGPTVEPGAIGVSALRPGKMISGFEPVSAGDPPLEARNAYGTAKAVNPEPSRPLM